jgi:hypothetical protein
MIVDVTLESPHLRSIVRIVNVQRLRYLWLLRKKSKVSWRLAWYFMLDSTEHDRLCYIRYHDGT